MSFFPLNLETIKNIKESLGRDNFYHFSQYFFQQPYFDLVTKKDIDKYNTLDDLSVLNLFFEVNRHTNASTVFNLMKPYFNDEQIDILAKHFIKTPDFNNNIKSFYLKHLKTKKILNDTENQLLIQISENLTNELKEQHKVYSDKNGQIFILTMMLLQNSNLIENIKPLFCAFCRKFPSIPNSFFKDFQKIKILFTIEDFNLEQYPELSNLFKDDKKSILFEQGISYHFSIDHKDLARQINSRPNITLKNFTHLLNFLEDESINHKNITSFKKDFNTIYKLSISLKKEDIVLLKTIETLLEYTTNASKNNSVIQPNELNLVLKKTMEFENLNLSLLSSNKESIDFSSKSHKKIKI